MKPEYRFKIEAFTPATIPMARLAEYLTDLADLLGNAKNVHFGHLEEGSTTVVHWVDSEVYPDVQTRLGSIQLGNPSKEVARAFDRLNERLASDQARASLFTPEANMVLRFPGRRAEDVVEFPPIIQQGTVEGVLISIGGKNDPVPVHLAEGQQVHLCDAARPLARELAPLLFGPVIRVRGNGVWVRDPAGAWSLTRFHIEGFETLEDAPLTQVVQELRDIPGSLWAAMPDPLGELHKLRHGVKSMEKAG